MEKPIKVNDRVEYNGKVGYVLSVDRKKGEVRCNFYETNEELTLERKEVTHVI